jgi:hypothetical protein
MISPRNVGAGHVASAAKSAGARCGVQATFAVGGYIETPNALSGEGL